MTINLTKDPNMRDYEKATKKVKDFYFRIIHIKHISIILIKKRKGSLLIHLKLLLIK